MNDQPSSAASPGKAPTPLERLGWAWRRLVATRPITKITAVTGLLALGLYALGMHDPATFRQSVHERFWLQVFTGNWSPDQPAANPSHQTPDSFISDPEYVIGAVLALVVNMGSYVLIFGTLWSVWKAERKKFMDIATAVRDRDSIVIATLQDMFRHSSLPKAQQLELAGRIETVFEKGVNDWATRYLRNKADDANAKEILGLLTPSR